MTALILLLAQTCVAEIGFRDNAAECVVMWAVNQRRADIREKELGPYTQEFNAYWDSPKQRLSRPWIQHLNHWGTQPEHWESGAWSTYRRRWAVYLDTATAWLSNQTDPCPRAGNYGGTPNDGKGADDPIPCNGYARRVRCLPGELQAYWDLRYCHAA